ncbi:MAG: aquaporin [Bacteroidota bacterium]|nr:aquaporin [Bacteroidota bacterium]
MNKFLSELISTFLLVLVCSGIVILDSHLQGKIGLIGISLTSGLAVSLLILFFEKFSGAHMNPAVTIGLATGGKFLKKDVLPYLLAQLTGAFLASGLYKLILPPLSPLGETLPSITAAPAFFFEMILTFFLLIVILITAKLKIKFDYLIIGGFVALGIYVGGPYCGGSMNPFRSVAPAVLSGNISMLWLYMSAPFIGAIIATLSFKVFLK